MTATALNPSDIFSAFLSWHEVAQLIESHRADTSVWRRALDHPEVRVRREAASHFSADDEVMARVADDPHNEVRQVAATSKATAPEVLARMVRDRSRAVREYVARNPHTPAEALERLAYDDSWEVRLHVAVQPMSMKALQHLARDPSIAIRQRIARRPDLPSHVALAMAADDDSGVRALIASRRQPQAVHEALVDDRSPEVVRALANNPSIGRPIAMQLSSHADRATRAALARTTDYDDVLDVLANDEDLTVRGAVAANVALPTTAAIRMLNSLSGIVKRTVLTVHIDRLPDDLVTRVLDEQLGTVRADIRAQVRRRFPNRITPRVITSPPALHDRRGLLEVVDRCLPFEFIAEAVHSNDVPVTVRAALLEHPLVPHHILEELKSHPAFAIRQAAQQPRKRYLP